MFAKADVAVLRDILEPSQAVSVSRFAGPITMPIMGNADKKLNALVGAVLKELRNQAGISQQELAFEYGLDRTYISLLERGLRQPTIRTVFILSEALEIKPSQFISKIENSV